jgi:hypothetical protein
MRVALVSCCGPKLDHAAPAKDLYVSDLFKKSRAWAERYCDRWAILSAKLRLVGADEVIEPYDVTLSEMTRTEREAWAQRTGAQIGRGLPRRRSPVTLVFLAGELYVACARHIPGPQVPREEPLKGMQIGERLSWLKDQLR